MAPIAKPTFSRLALVLLAAGQTATWMLVSTSLPGCGAGSTGCPALEVTLVDDASGVPACASIDNPCGPLWSNEDSLELSPGKLYFVEMTRDNTRTRRALCAKAGAPHVAGDPVDGTYKRETWSAEDAVQVQFLVSVTGPGCGNGIVDTVAGEQCDDGNLVNGDGCSAICQGECRALDQSCRVDDECCSGRCGTAVGYCIPAGPAPLR